MKPITKFAIVFMLVVAFLGTVIYVTSAPAKTSTTVSAEE